MKDPVAVRRLYEPGTNYKKAGLLAGALQPAAQWQTNLFAPSGPSQRAAALMEAENTEQIHTLLYLQNEIKSIIFDTGTNINWNGISDRGKKAPQEEGAQSARPPHLRGHLRR